ncbi:hypothetical protein DENSPDRAFT_887103 [Dentipellis sp. KUC8613]|nr:hypothetical protein DENSPDRAFT_887103 [Dentipellis sp. KUC8613]
MRRPSIAVPRPRVVDSRSRVRDAPPFAAAPHPHEAFRARTPPLCACVSVTRRSSPLPPSRTLTALARPCAAHPPPYHARTWPSRARTPPFRARVLAMPRLMPLPLLHDPAGLASPCAAPPPPFRAPPHCLLAPLPPPSPAIRRVRAALPHRTAALLRQPRQRCHLTLTP